MLGGWDHARTLAVLRLTPALRRFSDGGPLRFRRARADPQRRPQRACARCCSAMKASRAPAPNVCSTSWIRSPRSKSGAPSPSLRRTGRRASATLRNLFRPARPPSLPRMSSRSNGAASPPRCDLFDEALAEAASALDRRARDRHRALLARRQERAPPEAAAPRGRTPQRGPRAERSRSPPVGAAGRLRLRHGGKAVPALPPAGPVLPRRGALPPECSRHPRAHRRRIRARGARPVRHRHHPRHHAGHPLLPGVRCARRTQSAVPLPGRRPGAGGGFRSGPSRATHLPRTPRAPHRSAPRTCSNTCAPEPPVSRPRRSKPSCNARFNISRSA